MKKIKSLYARMAVLSIALMLVCSFANAQCSYTIGNYSAGCATQFLSISSNKCAVTSSVWEDFVITITVNQPGATYTAYPGGDCYVASSSTSGTTLTYVLRKNHPYVSEVGMAVHMTGTCQQNFVAIEILGGGTY